jgi:hypothetical protein
MIAFGAPWALAAGAALAGAAVLLHLFAPRPPARAPLPTARFLRESAPTLVRPRRVPSDVPVLALRVGLALLLGALFAQPSWAPAREEGTTRIVLLDRGAGMAGIWEAATARALAETEGRPRALVVPFDTAPGEPLTLAGSRDSEAAPPAALEAGGPSPAESSYLVALRALREASLGGTLTKDVEAVLVSRPRWSAWDPQLAALRTVAWPGPIRVVAIGSPARATAASGPGGPETAAPGGGSSAGGVERPVSASGVEPSAPASAERPAPLSYRSQSRVAAVPDPEGLHRPAAAALTVLGYEVLRSDGGGDGGEMTAAGLRFVPSDAPDLGASVGRAADGDTVVVFGAALAAATDTPDLAGLWDAGAWPEGATPARTLRVRRATLALAGTEERAPGAAAGTPGRRLPIAWEEGAPAAAALNVGAGCLVRFGGPLGAGSTDPDYPALIRTLADGCRDGTGRAVAVGPLDAAATALLAGEGDAAVAVSSLGVREGRPLEAWLLLAVVLVALAESALVASRRRVRGSGSGRDAGRRAWRSTVGAASRRRTEVRT